LQAPDPPAPTAVATTEGFQTAFLAALGIAVLGALLALVLLRPDHEAEDTAITATRTVTPCPGRASGMPALKGGETVRRDAS